MDLRERVEYMVKALVDEPQEVQVNQNREGDCLRLEIRVHPEDLGKVIGRKGRTVRALRMVAGAMATRLKTRVQLEIVE